MCLPANPLPPHGGGDPAEHGRGAGAPPSPEEMLEIVEHLNSGSQSGPSGGEVGDALRSLDTLAGCPAHARVILETPGAVAALVNVLKGEREIPLPLAARGAAAKVFYNLCDVDIHAGMAQEYIRAAADAGGVEAATECISTLLQSQGPDDGPLVFASMCVKLMGNLALATPSLSVQRFDGMLTSVADVLKRRNEHGEVVDELIASICVPALCNMVECHLPEDVVFANRTRVRELGCIEEVVQVMEKSLNGSSVMSGQGLFASLVTLFHFVNVGDEERVAAQRAAAANVLIECGGFAVVARVMRAYPQDAAIAEKGCGIFFRYGLAPGVAAVAIEKDGVQCVLDAMQSLEDDVAVQTMGCQALWNLAHDDMGVIHTISSEMGGLRRIVRAMELYPENVHLMEMALGALWNPLGSKNEAIYRELAEVGGIESIAKALLAHKEHAGIQSEGFAPLEFASRSNSLEVKIAFLESPSAVPALQQVLNSIPPWWMPQLMTWELVDKHERVSNAIGRLGLMEVNMIGDDEFDGDNEQDECCKVQDAPFDIGVLLDKDLTEGDDAPGWIKAYPFHLDRECSAGGKKILHPYSMPVIGDYVCLRVKIPFGGRGYLYGKVSGVGPLPSEEDLASNGSRLFGKGCPCSNPECRFRDSKTRDQLLAAGGSLHGHEITCLASLGTRHEIEDGEKLRRPPLVPFFRGEDTKFRLTLRFDEAFAGSWLVAQISLADKE
ncbi:hypothetical protein ACHAXT_001733 [Thalassiosira profunda]